MKYPVLKIDPKILAIVLIILCVLLISWFNHLGVFDVQEMRAYDWLMRMRPIETPHPEIVIIEISDDTLGNLGQWPISRDYHAALLKVLSEAGARVVVMDLLLSEPDTADAVLSQAMLASGNVYLPYAFRIEKRGGEFVAAGVLAGISAGIVSAVSGAGHINVIVDPDGKVRRLPLLLRHRKKDVVALGVLAAAARMGYDAHDIRVDERGIARLGNRLLVPLDREGAIWVNYPGPWTKTFRHYSYFDILKAHADKKKGLRPRFDTSVLKDKICFVGLTAAGTSDLRANPFDPVYPMVGVHASICDSVLRNAFIKRLSLLFRSLIDSGFFLAGIKICLAFSPVAAFFACIALAVIWLGMSWISFSFWGFLGISWCLFG